MSTLKAESGARLLSRISSELRPTLDNLCNDIFPDNGPLTSQVIEITGESNTGKSHFLMEIMARTVLPHTHGGREASVVLFNLGKQFKVQRFVHILEKVACQSSTTPDEETRKTIENSLHRLLVYRCYTPEEYEMAQMQADDLLASNTNIALAVIDSISTFYYLDCKQKTALKMDTYLKKAIQELQRMCQEHRIVIGYARPAHFAANTDRLPTTDSNSPDYRIRLISHDSEGVCGFEAQIDARGQSKETFYTIDNFGVKFLNLE